MRMRFATIPTIAILFTTLAAAACGGSGTRIIPGPTDPPPVIIDPPPPPPPPDPLPTLGSVTRILAFGDSLTEGESTGQLLWDAYTSHDHSTPGKSTSYPYKLQTLLDTTYGDGKIRVFNGGRGGEFVIRGETKQRMIDEIVQYKPHVMLFMHGVNDLNLGVAEDEDADQTINNVIAAIEELIEIAKVTGSPKPHVMVASLPRQTESTKARAGQLIVPFNEVLLDVAGEESATFVDVYKVVSSGMLMPDGLHITPEGNQKIADAFFAAIKKKYNKEPAALR